MKVKMIGIAELLSSSAQPRISFDDQRLKELAQSLTVHGVLQPLIVRKKFGTKFEIIAGERRWRAAQIANLAELPCLISDLTDEASLAIALVENIQREDLNPIEEALAYQRLLSSLGLSQEEVALKVGKDRSSVANMLRLLRLAKPVQEMLISGEISMGHARALLALASEEMRLMLAQKIAREGLSVRRAESLVRTLNNGSRLEKAAHDANLNTSISDPMHKEIRQKLEHRFGTRVLLKKEESGFVMAVYYEDYQQLNSILHSLDIDI